MEICIAMPRLSQFTRNIEAISFFGMKIKLFISLHFLILSIFALSYSEEYFGYVSFITDG